MLIIIFQGSWGFRLPIQPLLNALNTVLLTFCFQLDDDAILARVRESAAIYGYSAAEIAGKSEVLLGSSPSEVESIEENLKAFLPPEVHAACAKAGAFNDMFSNAMDELRRVRDLISQSDIAFK